MRYEFAYLIPCRADEQESLDCKVIPRQVTMGFDAANAEQALEEVRRVLSEGAYVLVTPYTDNAVDRFVMRQPLWLKRDERFLLTSWNFSEAVSDIKPVNPKHITDW